MVDSETDRIANALREPFERISDAGEMMAYKHEGFWKCMDTFKDNLEFEQLWSAGGPWKVW